MPVYEYRCPEGHLFDRMHKITEKPRARCPVCGKAGSRLISAAGLVFKGTGFYITDYARKDGRKAADAPEGPAGGDAKVETKEGAKSEAKAGAPAEAKPEAKARSKEHPKPHRKGSA